MTTLTAQRSIDDFLTCWQGQEGGRARLEAERRQAKSDKQSALDLDTEEDTDDDAPKKPKYPTGDDLAETIAVTTARAAAQEPFSSSTIAARFAQGRAVEKRIATTIAALSRLGHLSSTDGRKTFALSRL